MTDAVSTEREQIKRVGREVMGWRHPSDLDHHSTRYWRSATGVMMTFAGDEDTEGWNPFSSASDDYMVLEHIREHWEWDRWGDENEPQGERLIRALARLLYERLWPDIPLSVDMPAFWVVRAYTPGDWSRAALRVLDAQKETT